MAKTQFPGDAPAAPKTAPVAPVGFAGQVAASLAANQHAAGANGSNFAGDFTGQTLPGAVDPYDYSADPILNKIKAGTAKARVDAQSAKVAALQDEAIRFGDGSDLNDPTVAAEAAGNPFSVLAALKRDYDNTVHDHGETLNQNNLWYSGAHAKQLADDALGYQGQEYQARSAHNATVGGIGSALATALSGADSADIGAETDAAGRATARATAAGYDPGAQTSVTNTGATLPSAGTTVNGNTTTTVSGGAPPVPANGAPQSSTFGGSAGPYIASYPTATKATQAPKAKALSNPYVTGTKRG